MQFAKNLRELRAKHNITQEALAEKVGVSRQMVARYESGENYPEMDKAIEIAKVLNCTLDDLVNSKDYTETYNPLVTQNVSVRIEKPRMKTKDKIIYGVLACCVSLFVLASIPAGVSEISEKAGEAVAAWTLMPMIGSWFAIAMYFKSR